MNRFDSDKFYRLNVCTTNPVQGRKTRSQTVTVPWPNSSGTNLTFSCYCYIPASILTWFSFRFGLQCLWIQSLQTEQQYHETEPQSQCRQFVSARCWSRGVQWSRVRGLSFVPAEDLNKSVKTCMCRSQFENLKQVCCCLYDLPACGYVYAFVITCKNVESD